MSATATTTALCMQLEISNTLKTVLKYCLLNHLKPIRRHAVYADLCRAGAEQVGLRCAFIRCARPFRISFVYGRPQVNIRTRSVSEGLRLPFRPGGIPRLRFGSACSPRNGVGS